MPRSSDRHRVSAACLRDACSSHIACLLPTLGAEDSGPLHPRMRGCQQEACKRTVALEAEFFSQAALFPDNGAFCISNPHLPDCPLTYANPVFLRNTGYTLEEVIGANCRFLQVCVGSCMPRARTHTRPGPPPRSVALRHVLFCRSVANHPQCKETDMNTARAMRGCIEGFMTHHPRIAGSEPAGATHAAGALRMACTSHTPQLVCGGPAAGRTILQG